MDSDPEDGEIVDRFGVVRSAAHKSLFKRPRNSPRLSRTDEHRSHRGMNNTTYQQSDSRTPRSSKNHFKYENRLPISHPHPTKEQSSTMPQRREKSHNENSKRGEDAVKSHKQRRSRLQNVNENTIENTNHVVNDNLNVCHAPKLPDGFDSRNITSQPRSEESKSDKPASSDVTKDDTLLVIDWDHILAGHCNKDGINGTCTCAEQLQKTESASLTSNLMASTSVKKAGQADTNGSYSVDNCDAPTELIVIDSTSGSSSNENDNCDDENDDEVEELQLRREALVGMVKKMEDCTHSDSGIPDSCTSTQETSSPTSSNIGSKEIGTFANKSESPVSSKINMNADSRNSPAIPSEKAIDFDEELLRTELLLDVSRRRSLTTNHAIITLKPASINNGTDTGHASTKSSRSSSRSATFKSKALLPYHSPKRNALTATTNESSNKIPGNVKPIPTASSHKSSQSVRFVEMEHIKTPKAQTYLSFQASPRSSKVRRTKVDAEAVKRRFHRYTHASDEGSTMRITIPNNINPSIISLQDNLSSEEYVDGKLAKRPKKVHRVPATKKFNLRKDSPVSISPTPHKKSPHMTWRNPPASSSLSSVHSQSKPNLQNSTSGKLQQLPASFEASLSRLLINAKKESDRALREEAENEKREIEKKENAKRELLNKKLQNKIQKPEDGASVSAMKHLPLDKQVEYMKLKSKILELEHRQSAARLNLVSESVRGGQEISSAKDTRTVLVRKRSITSGSPAKPNNPQLTQPTAKVTQESVCNSPANGEQNASSSLTQIGVEGNSKQKIDAQKNTSVAIPDTTTLGMGNMPSDVLVRSLMEERSTSIPPPPLSPEQIEIEKQMLFRREKQLKEKLLKNMQISESHLKLVTKEQQLTSTRTATIKNLSSCIANTSKLTDYEMACRKTEKNIIVIQQQLKIANDNLREQKYRADSVKTEVDSSKKTILESTLQCLTLEQECEAIGKKLKGPDYTAPTHGKQELKLKLDEMESRAKIVKSNVTTKYPMVPKAAVAALRLSASIRARRIAEKNKNWRKSNFRISTSGRRYENSQGESVQALTKYFSEDSDEEEVFMLPRSNFQDRLINVKPITKKKRSGLATYEKYTSPLRSVGGEDKGAIQAQMLGMAIQKINPAVTMCTFELRGICNSEACNFQHLYRP